MSTYTQIFYQIVFSTKNREAVLIKENREKLFRYIRGILKNKDSVLYQINGIEDHIHIFTHVNPKISVSQLVRDIKKSSNRFIKKNNLFPDFSNWQIGYGAFTYSIREKEMIINYIKNQEIHHRKVSFIEELKQLFEENCIEFDESYLL